MRLHHTLVDRGAGRDEQVCASGLLCSTSSVDAAKLSWELDFLEVRTGIHVLFEIQRDRSEVLAEAPLVD